jgi:hypothetical protein
MAGSVVVMMEAQSGGKAADVRLKAEMDQLNWII